MGLRVKIDTSALADAMKEYAEEVQQDVEKAVALLAEQTHRHVLIEAEEKLSSQSFLKFKKFVAKDEGAPGIHVITIEDGAMWIEEGIKPNTDMKPALLKNGKVSPNTGFKYQIIPFDKGKTPTTSTPFEQQLSKMVQKELRSQNIPYKKIEKDQSGNPRLGLLHKLDIKSEIPGKGNTPALKGVNIYQTMTSSGNVRRDILTFRTVSGGPASEGKWIHPGLPAQKFLDKAAEWAEKEWENTMLPEIAKKWSK